MMEQLTFIHRVLVLIDGETESLTSIMPDNSLNAINISLYADDDDGEGGYSPVMWRVVRATLENHQWIYTDLAEGDAGIVGDEQATQDAAEAFAAAVSEAAKHAK